MNPLPTDYSKAWSLFAKDKKKPDGNSIDLRLRLKNTIRENAKPYSTRFFRRNSSAGNTLADHGTFVKTALRDEKDYHRS